MRKRSKMTERVQLTMLSLQGDGNVEETQKEYVKTPSKVMIWASGMGSECNR
jgi:hypothetical protein